MKFAIIHDWLIGMRGGEKVLEQVLQLFPDSEIFTLFYKPENISPLIRDRRVHTSWLQKIPGSLKFYRHLLPLFPTAVKSWHFNDFDAIISISHCAAKGIKIRNKIPHICYCLTPMRYIWDNFEAYFARGRSPTHVRFVMRMVRPYLKWWDVRSTKGVDHIIGISQFVADRIKKYYSRDAGIIYPPVDTDYFDLPGTDERDDYYIIVSALVPYKKIDIAVQAFNKSINKKLKIVGVGPESARLRRLSTSDNVEFLDSVDTDNLRRLYQRARGLIYCGEEDFGIVMVEAQACGTPVIAYHRGGAAEIVRHGETGVLYSGTDAESLTEAVKKADNIVFSRDTIRRQALNFSAERFRREFYDAVKSTVEKIRT
jgi:glycosyltransferase involved in cell wall biosynthesis